jgi:hypothetical protein
MSLQIPQTTVKQYFDSLILGMLAYVTGLESLISRTGKGIIYFGRALVQCKLSTNVDQRNYPLVRMPRSNYFTQTFTGTMSAGSVSTVITSGKITSGNVTEATAASNAITTAFSVNLATTMALHAANIAAAMADCFSCAYSAGTLTYKGDADDVSAVSTTFTSPGSGDTAAAAAATIATWDTIADVIGVSFLTSDRQQQLTTGYNYFVDKEAINIVQRGTLAVQTEVATKPNDSVYTRFIQNSNGWVGDFTNVVDSSTCLILTGAKYQQLLTAAGLTLLTLNLPNA